VEVLSMSDPISVLVVDDDDEGRALLVTVLEALGFRVAAVPGATEAMPLLQADAMGARDSAPIDIVLLDVLMPGIDGLELLKRYRAAGGRRPVVMVTAIDEAATAVQAVRLGANDYVTKPLDGDELREMIERLTPGQQEKSAAEVAPGRGPASRLGDSSAMRRVGELIERIADVDVPILITGESGVGKDVAAREVHGRSARRGKVFVKINCAALPAELLESELFGHERGSFTGAARTKPGQFELADGGTLFLDEIGEMPVVLQAKLLQALQDGEFYRVGGQRKIRVDARVICATNRNLQKAILDGSFREDLYYRLNVVHFEIPPLRERREDIPALVEHFADKYARRYGRPVEMPTQLMQRFMCWDWPGNIRELENLVRRLVVLRDPSYVLAELRDRPGAATPSPPSPPSPSPLPGAPWPPAERGTATATWAAPPVDDRELRIDLKEVGRKAAHVAEREAIVTMLGHTGGNKREAAERLGISYKAILYKIREFGIGRPRLPRRPAGPFGVESSPDAAMPSVAALGDGDEPEDD
jgi:two-component system response regulator AtoC